MSTKADEKAAQQAEEEAREEPEVLTPEEEAERSVQALARGAALAEAGQDPARLSDADSPLRMPGESSPRRH